MMLSGTRTLDTKREGKERKREGKERKNDYGRQVWKDREDERESPYGVRVDVDATLGCTYTYNWREVSILLR